ncbi:MAG: hypothetical protein JRG91_09070 [Deltaproteobacteria bacterium]|nr:hypothetical protein [Deltaproteobacteria bacterium]
MNASRSISAILLLVLALAGCKQQPGTQEAPAAEEKAAAAAGTAVERIVFIDMVDACDCTQKKIATAQKALDETTKGEDIPVERIHMDTEDEKADVYRDKKAFMVIPALYFLDDAGNVLTLLQGDVTEKQITEALFGSL